MKDYELTVIVPVYNGEKYIRRCIESIINQTIFPKIELLVINDGSTDSTKHILDDYVHKYPENIYSFNTQNGGVSAARNVGIEKAHGDYVTFVDADDWVEPDSYRTLICGKNTVFDIICAGFIVNYKDGLTITNSICSVREELQFEDAIREFLEGKIDVHVCTKVFKRDVLKDIRFDKDIKVAEDRIFTCECLASAKKIVKIPLEFYHYYQNLESVMHEEFLEKRFGDIDASKKIISIIESFAPCLKVYAECMDINAKCRIVGEMYCSPKKKEYQDVYEDLTEEIRNFRIIKGIKYSSKKHWISLIICKINPGLYNLLRNNKYLRFSKM